MLVGGSTASDWLFTKLYELLPSFVLKTSCECSSKSNYTTINKKLLQKQSCFGWRNLILSRPLREHSRFQIHGSFIHIAYDCRSQNAFTSTSGSGRLRGSFSIILSEVSCLFSFFKSLSKLFKNVRWSYYWATDCAGEVGKPSQPFLLANAVSHANPEVITFPVVHNKPTWCYPLNKNEYADWTYSQRIPSTT